MSSKYFSCPNKANLRDLTEAERCKGCDKYYHKSCAKRAGPNPNGVYNKCCRDEIFIEDSENITDLNTILNSDFDMSSSRKSDMMNQTDSIVIDDQFKSLKKFIIDGVVGKLDELIQKFDAKNKEVDNRLNELEKHVASIALNTTETVIFDIRNRKNRETFFIFANMTESRSEKLNK